MPAPAELVYDSSGSHLECNQIMGKFGGRDWRDLSIDDLEYESDALAFLTPRGFRFLLPAFIRACALDYERADLIPHAIVWNLLQHDDPDFRAACKDRLDLLTGPQREVLRCLISWLRTNHSLSFLHGELEQARETLASYVN